MSQQDVEVFRAYHDALLRTTEESLDPEEAISRMAEFWDSEVEYDMSASPWFDIGGVYRGTEAVRQLWRQWLAAWGTLQFNYELVDAGDRVVVLLDTRTRGRSTGIEVPLGNSAFVTTFRDGLIVHNKLYMSHSEALEAVGQSEQEVRP